MLDILNEMFPESVANRTFTFVSHRFVDLVKGDLIYGELMRYPSYLVDMRWFSAYYFLIFNI